jgi:hypothetical protein
VFGVKPELGRAFVDDEMRPGAPSSVIVSHEFWQKYLGANPNAPGKTIKIGTELLTIVGVMPASMNYPREMDCGLRTNPTFAGAGRRAAGARSRA